MPDSVDVKSGLGISLKNNNNNNTQGGSKVQESLKVGHRRWWDNIHGVGR